MSKVSILGTEYNVIISDLNDEDLSSNDGVCKFLDKEIVIRDRKYIPGGSDKAKDERIQTVLYHELVHAFGHESGTSYDNNEELTDWIARMIPKINKAYQKIRKDLGI